MAWIHHVPLKESPIRSYSKILHYNGSPTDLNCICYSIAIEFHWISLHMNSSLMAWIHYVLLKESPIRSYSKIFHYNGSPIKSYSKIFHYTGSPIDLNCICYSIAIKSHWILLRRNSSLMAGINFVPLTEIPIRSYSNIFHYNGNPIKSYSKIFHYNGSPIKSYSKIFHYNGSPTDLNCIYVIPLQSNPIGSNCTGILV